MTPLLLIAGPTASGKTALALRAAREWDGEIVNADAIQLYRDLRVLSARPSPEEEAQAPHHLFGIADAADGWSVGRWLRAALEAVEAVRARGRTVVVVGGTGLYFRALTRGLAETPGVPPSVRAAVGSRFEALGEDAFRAALAQKDPDAAARIYPGDRQRLMRAMEVVEATGRPLTEWQSATRPPIPAGDWTGVVLEPPRDLLYARCDARLLAMMREGALDEAHALMARSLHPALPVMKAVGLRELARALSGELSPDDALALAQQETRRYAKRQTTWFRNQTPDWPRVAESEPARQWAKLKELLR